MEQVAHPIYFREIDLEGGIDSLARVAQWIPAGSMVLDLGCSSGALGKCLTTQKHCTIDGVERDPEAAELATPHYRTMVVTDLDQDDLATHLGGQRYDYVVCADVLEHLKSPERILAQLPHLLAPSGRILLSIPNVAYAGLIAALMNGDFQYRPTGLLDRTHLRFFTRKSLLRWLASCNFQVIRTDTIALPINQSEFAADHLEALPPAVLRTLLGLPDALTYQFIVEAALPGDAVPTTIVKEPETAAFSFMAQLFHRTNHPFDEAHSTSVHGAVGVDRQRLHFQIPASSLELSGLRLDPANRPGYLQLYEMALFDANHTCVWKWDPAMQGDSCRRNQVRFIDKPGIGSLLVLEGDDPWFELPLAQEDLVRMRDGGVLEVDLSWPQAPDSFLVIERLVRREGQLKRIAELETAGDALRKQVEGLVGERARRETERLRLVRLTDDLRSHIRDLTRELSQVQLMLKDARATLVQINHSLTFRLARPFFTVINKIRGRAR